MATGKNVPLMKIGINVELMKFLKFLRFIQNLFRIYLGFIQDLFRIYSRIIKDLLRFIVFYWKMSCL